VCPFNSSSENFNSPWILTPFLFPQEEHHEAQEILRKYDELEAELEARLERAEVAEQRLEQLDQQLKETTSELWVKTSQVGNNLLGVSHMPYTLNPNTSNCL
jgi:hypothetical protein